MRRPPSIRRAFTVLGAGLSLIVLLLAVTVGGAVTRLYVLSDEFEETVAAVRAVEEIEVNLFVSTREHQLFGETGDPKWRAGWQRADAALVQRVREINELAKLPQERELVDRLTESINRIRQDVLAAPPGERIITRTEIDQAFADAEALLAFYDRTSAEAVERTRNWSRVALLVSISTLALTVFGLASAMGYARRNIYLPVIRLRRSLETHAVGEEVRVAEEATCELREIASGVNQLVDRITAQRLKHLTFLAAVAHDLRNPMNGLRMTAQLASRQPDPEKQSERMKLIVRQVDRMNRLVEDLLDVNRIEAGQFDLHLERRDLREAVRETSALFEGTSEIHPIRCEVPEEPLVVPHDPARITQVLGNLVSNAIKYSPEGGLVEVRLRSQGDDAIIEVQDAGLGVPPEERDTIFMPFRRSGGARGEIPGVGLGLSVSRKLIRAHGGDIEVESQLGRGSTFRVRLPIRKA